jgi:RNA polymerase sigma factor, sigma-70 family
MEDGEILTLFRQRDQQAIPAVEERYGQRLQALAQRLLGSPEDAEECVSDTYLAAWNAIPPEEPVYLFAYLAAICRNKALSMLSRENTQKRRGELVTLTAELEQCIPDNRREMEQDAREIGEALSRFLEGLGEENRRLFLRRYWYAESVKEVAQNCGVSESKVKMSLHRTRKKLREFLQKEGLWQ